MSLPGYGELLCCSNFSFLRGASHPGELVERAKAMGYAALAITDECSMAGIAQAHVAAKKHGLPLIVGSQFSVQASDGPTGDFTLALLATSLQGYGNLCELITRLRRSADKGTYRLRLGDVESAALADCLAIAVPPRGATQDQCDTTARWLLGAFLGRCWLGVTQLGRLDDAIHLHRLREAGALTAVPLVAVGDVHMHVRSRKPLQDVLTAIRIGRPLTACGFALTPNAEQHLRTRVRLAQSFPPELLAETLRIAGRCAGWSLDELRYQYPAEVVPPGRTPAQHLRDLTEAGAASHWPEGVPPKVRDQIEHELALITELGYEHYFLTVHDIVAYARSQGILCQGRGSAANSAVCYCLGVTAVDPARSSLLFERFLSKERNEPPDIDVDFEHERREEVIQYLYRKYGRDRAALTATVIRYRPRSTVRDVGKALGFDDALIERLARDHRWWDEDGLADTRLREAGLDPDSVAARQFVTLVKQLLGFPRHLSQHTGGFVLTSGPLARLVPIENASMPDRTVIQWDKDDLDAMGLLKVDVLALGMLTAIRKSLDFIGRRRGRPMPIHTIPDKDEATFDMICAADTVGVFQIESRAQMAMLPRLRPRTFYDLVVEVALVRPGPIQGGAVHPYLRRRQGKEEVEYPKGLEAALERTLGVPVFQEQCMQIAMIAADFTPGEADGLRRAMGAWRRNGGLGAYEHRLIDGMTRNNYPLEFAQRVVEQVKGFSSYGFPESHAVSFALLVYDSCWIKRHHPAEFLAAMLNSQPLGFYTPSQLVQDAQRHGVVVRPADVGHSDWDCTLEDMPAPEAPGQPAVRLGLRLVSGLSKEDAQRISAARMQRPFASTEDLALRAPLDRQALQHLAAADALQSLAGHRRQQVWDASALQAAPALLRRAPVNEATLDLDEAPEGEAIVWDYASTGLTLRRHPLALLRERLTKRRFMTAAQLKDAPDGRLVRACGIVTCRQQPGTSQGVVFVTLEDETGTVQVIVWRALRQRQRAELTGSRLLAVHGVWQRDGEVCNLIAGRLENLNPLLGRLAPESRDFH
ncbi:error-prone DNA polymerase [Hydrogenophaga pseudoflava]|uniref:error-prone DNA polymerase n=1 Tax=Hydrogenophaga pseudoflava TaxID=47421 RepID=UPI0027E55153|nr:error-prone DNA polymerase [Hydrogenophaga pseudoflava]MDQ7743294.1 error-prone DNA polymerase [Hydrogenophaga pseudoflava]